MSKYKNIINPHTGKLQKVLTDDYIKAIDDIADAIAKKHAQNTDEYLNTQVTTTLYVDGNRTDSYTANGSITKPFKTIQSAIDSVSDASENKRYSVNIAGGKTYEEQVTLKSHVYLKSDKIAVLKNTGDSTIIASGSGSQSMRIEKLIVLCYSDDESHSALSVSGTGNVSIYDCLLYGNSISYGLTGAEGLRMTLGTVSGHESSFQGWNWAFNMSGGNATLDTCTFTGWGNDVQRTGGTLQLGLPKYSYGGVVGTYTHKYNASIFGNDSSVTGDTIKDALDALDNDITTLEGRAKVITLNLPTTTIANGESIQIHRFTVPSGVDVKVWSAGLSSEAGTEVSGAKIQIYNETDTQEEYATNSTFVTGEPIDTLSLAGKDVSIKVLNDSGLAGDFSGFITITLE